MTGKDLFKGMSWVDERLIDEAENAQLPKSRVVPWIKIASTAACLCLIMFGIHHLMPYWNPGPTEGQDDKDILAQGGIGDELKEQSDQSAIVSPGDDPAMEVPSVILYVDDMTDLGFTGTVTQLVDTDVFDIGMELNVVMADGTRHETDDENPAMSDHSRTDYSGRCVMVQFIEYDRKTGTIVANMITEVPTEKG